MNKRPLFFPLYALYVCILFFGSVPGFLYPMESEYDLTALKFSGLRTWAETNSPVYRLIEERNKLRSAEARIGSGLQATNPQFNYSHEYVKEGSFSEREQLFTLSKTFEMPWLYSKRRQGYGHMENALEFKKESEIRQFMARMKSGYAALSVMKDRLDVMAEVKTHLRKAAATAETRRENGFLTGYETQLIDIALLDLEGKTLTLTRRRRELENRWKMEMGIEPGKLLSLTDRMTFKPLEIEKLEIEKILNRMPGFSQREQEARVLSFRLKMEKMSIIPDVTLFAGYKTVTPGLKGYAVGLSFDLPVLNRNRDAIRKRELEIEVHKNRFALFKKENLRRLREKMKALKEYSAFLGPMDMHFNSLRDQLDPVVSAYEEGLLSANDFVNILQTHMGAVERYYGHLLNYFKTINDVEAMTGSRLITF